MSRAKLLGERAKGIFTALPNFERCYLDSPPFRLTSRAGCIPTVLRRAGECDLMVIVGSLAARNFSLLNRNYRGQIKTEPVLFHYEVIKNVLNVNGFIPTRVYFIFLDSFLIQQCFFLLSNQFNIIETILLDFIFNKYQTTVAYFTKQIVDKVNFPLKKLTTMCPEHRGK